MRYLPALLAAVLVMCLASPGSAQEWTFEQMEVWAFQLSCHEKWQTHDIPGHLACLHDDYKGWWGAAPVPLGKSEARLRHYHEVTDIAVLDLRPLDIIVNGNMAVVHYLGAAIETGDTEATWFRCTDVLVKKNGAWSWIADNCGPDARTVGSDD
jgi:hypothetical protein